MKQTYFVNYRFLLPLLVLLASLTSNSGKAQCGLYQVFESFSGASVTGGSAGTLQQGVSSGNYWTHSGTVGITASGYSGVKSAQFTTLTSFIVTPSINNLKTLSFYYKNITGAAGNLKVQYSYTSSAGPWTDYTGNTIAITTTAYANYSFDFTTLPLTGPVWVKILRNGGASVPNIDDLAWTSSVDSENLMIVPPKSASATTCNAPLLAGYTYTIYDNGGLSDNYNVGQDNTITVVPPTGYNAVFTMNSSTTVNNLSSTAGACPASGTQDELFIYNGTTSGSQVGYYQNGCATRPIPATSITSSGDCFGRLTARLFSDATANAASAVGINISVTTVVASACLDVSNVLVTAGSATSDGATVTWTAPCPAPLSYDYYVSASSTAPTGSTPATGTVSGASPTVTITGLSGNTPYYVWIRSNCGSGVYSLNWISPGTGPHFTTLCSPYSVPYLEDFNGLNGPLPLCTSTNAGAGIWKTNLTNGNLYASSASAVNTMFYTRPISLISGNTYRLTYDYSTLNGTADFNVYYGTVLTAPSATSVATLLVTHTGISGITSNVVDFVAPSTGIFYIGFKITSLSVPASTFFNLDNISLDVETCFAPTGVSHANETQSSSDISWTAPASVPSNGYQYYLSTDSTTPNYNVPPTGTATASPVTPGGLTPGTTYYLWVRSDCGGKYSVWSAYTTFTTVAAPAATVINLPLGTNSITTCNALFYDAGGSAANYASSSGGSGTYLTSTYTIAPGTPGKQIKVVFSSFATENRYDGLMIYDGANTSAPLLSSGAPAGTDAFSCPAGAYSGTNSPGTVYSTLGNGLTFVFKADYLISAAGWAATVSCVTLPLVTSFTPTGNSCGGTGTVVTITGANFQDATAPITSVKFNGVSAGTPSIVNNTTMTVTLPAGATTGPITVSNAQATSTSSAAFQVLGAAPTVSANQSVCPGNSATFTSSFNCTGYGNSGLTYAGTWSAAGPTANKPTSAGNSSTCNFTTTQMPYVSTTFQVSVTGTYIFAMTDYGTYDAMAYITSGAFVPGSCGSGTLIKVDDDSGAGFQPQLTANLVQGVTYTLYTTVYSNPGGTFAFDYTITPPTGGELMLLTNTLNWYDTAAGTTVLAQGSSFDPVAAGAVNPYTPGVYTFYAACASNTTCRTPFTFTIKTPPTVTLTASGSVCSNRVKTLTATGTSTSLLWSSSVANTLFQDANCSIPYTNQNLTTVYLKTTASVIITVVGTDSATTCDTTVTSNQTISTKTWNGAWSGNGFVPTSGETIVIANSGTFTNLGGCSCTVNAGATVVVNGTMTLNGDLNVSPSATMTFNDDASLVQIDTPSPTNTNVGNIIYKRNTLMRKMDYTYWGAPVQAQYLYQSSATPPFLDGVGAPLPMQSDKYYWFDTSINNWTAPTPAAPVSATTMSIGRGYIIRAPLTVDPYTAQPVTFTFTGKPNNGDYSVNIVKGTGDLNCISNPYPSAISANLFISQNTAAFGSGAGSGTSLYFWTHNTPMTNNAYTFSDYAVYNYSGGTVTTSGASPAPNGKIAAGQGFMAKAIFAGTRVATFTNSMRLSGALDNTYFYKSSNATAADDFVASLERNRVWLNMTNTDGYFKQILVGYIQNASNGLDNGFDGESIEAGNAISFYSLVADKKLTIQGKALPFADSDLVPLGYKSAIATSYTIALADFDGLFADQQVYLEDKSLHLVHPLTNNPYTFATEAGTFDTRFVLRFTDTMLSVSNPELSANSVVVVKENSNIHIRTSAVKMKSVQIYDARGRLVAEKQKVNDNSVSFENLNFASQVLIVNITSEDGIMVSKKIIF